MTADLGGERVIEAAEADFARLAVEASQSHPVIAEFYATWCDPCARIAGPLESAVRHAGGEITLVKVDIDKNPALADRLFVTAIPALFVFKQGRPVLAEAGVIGAHLVQALVADAFSPGGGEDLRAQAAAKMDEGDYDAAVRLYAMLHFADPADTAALAGVARAYNGAGERARAQAALALAADPDDPSIAGARAAFELIEAAPSSLEPLRAAAQAAPDDAAAKLAYARGLAGFTHYGEAADLLRAHLAAPAGRNDAAAKGLLQKVLAAAGLPVE